MENRASGSELVQFDEFGSYEIADLETSLANANQQYVQSLARWRAARIRLAASVGMLARNDQMVPM